MRALSFAFLLFLVLGTAVATPAVAQFDSEEKAKIRCPMDKIVWINPHTHRWYPRGSRHYADDRWGGFACLGDVKAARIKKGKG